MIQNNTLNILITGGLGFIGSHLTKRIINKYNYKIAVIDLNDNGLWRIKDISSNVKIYYEDLSKTKSLKTIFSDFKVDVIFHLSSTMDNSRDSSLLRESLENNLFSTLNLLENCPDTLKKFFHTGTCEEYGDNIAPFNEDVKERAVSPYSLSKICSTYLCDFFYRVNKYPILIIRPFLTYGPMQYPSLLIPSLIIKCLENKDFDLTLGEHTREFIFYKNIIDILEKLLHLNTNEEIINIGSGKEIKVKEVALLIKRLSKSSSNLNFGAIPYRVAEPLHFYSDNNRLLKIIGEYSFTPIEEGLNETINWYKENLKCIKK